MPEDKNLTCVECHQPFVFPASMQQKLTELAAAGKIDRYNEPKRCQPCRAAKKKQHQDQGRR